MMFSDSSYMSPIIFLSHVCVCVCVYVCVCVCVLGEGVKSRKLEQGGLLFSTTDGKCERIHRGPRLWWLLIVADAPAAQCSMTLNK